MDCTGILTAQCTCKHDMRLGLQQKTINLKGGGGGGECVHEWLDQFKSLYDKILVETMMLSLLEFMRPSQCQGMMML